MWKSRRSDPALVSVRLQRLDRRDPEIRDGGATRTIVRRDFNRIAVGFGGGVHLRSYVRAHVCLCVCACRRTQFYYAINENFNQCIIMNYRVYTNSGQIF